MVFLLIPATLAAVAFLPSEWMSSEALGPFDLAMTVVPVVLLFWRIGVHIRAVANATRPAMDSARDFYLAGGVGAADIQYVTDVRAGHAFLALGGPNACATTQPPFVNDCGIDQAGEILVW